MAKVFQVTTSSKAKEGHKIFNKNKRTRSHYVYATKSIDDSHDLPPLDPSFHKEC